MFDIIVDHNTTSTGNKNNFAAGVVQNFETFCKDPSYYQLHVLELAFKINAGVVHLRNHGVEVTEDFEPRQLLAGLPLTTYSDYMGVVDEALKVASTWDPVKPSSTLAAPNFASNLVGETPWAFFTSSGTTGKAKKIPGAATSTLETCKSLAITAESDTKLKPLFTLPDGRPGRLLNLMFCGRDLPQLQSGVVTGSGTECFFRRLLATGAFVDDGSDGKNPWASPAITMTAGSNPDVYYCHWLCALARAEEVVSVSDIFAAGLMVGVQVLHNKWRMLVSDLRNGRISQELKIRQEVCEVIESQVLCGPNTQAADSIEMAIHSLTEHDGDSENGYTTSDTGVPETYLLQALFPNLRVIKCVTTGSMCKYVPRIKAMAPKAAIFSPLWASSEAMLGVNMEPFIEGNTLEAYLRNEVPQLYVPYPHTTCYYEFVPLEEVHAAKPNTVAMTNLEVGKTYEVVVTNLAGLFRYRMGDTVRCMGWFHKTPRLEFVGRLGQVLDIVGEKTSKEQLIGAIVAAANACLPKGVGSLMDFSSRELIRRDGPSSYVVYWELAHCQNSTSTDKCRDVGGEKFNMHGLEDWHARAMAQGFTLDTFVQECASVLEEELCRAATYYEEYGRAVNKLGPVELRLVRPGTFAHLRRLALEDGASPAQYKPPAVIFKPHHVEFLDSAVVVAGQQHN